MSWTRRDTLRGLVLGWDSARPPQRSHGGQPLWPALVAGHWSLLDSFTAAGARYIVACRNPDAAAQRRALVPRQARVLELALAGRSGKWTALEMQLSESAIARTLRTALQKLGVSSTDALAGLQTVVFEPIEGLHAGVELALARREPAVERRRARRRHRHPGRQAHHGDRA
jgi:DNA-binding CsgD family transcriptional regulator